MLQNKAGLLNPRHINFWIMLVFVVGIALRCVHFFGRSSMWFDELTSALNIRDRSFFQLATQSLDHNQVAPVGFLLLEKLATVIFGVNDHAYRFFPFVFSICSLLLFLNISKFFLKGIPLLCSFILFACSVSTWFYGGEAKQYSGDIAAALFLVWAGLKISENKLSRSIIWFIALTGIVLILSSLPALVIAPFVLSIVFIKVLRKQTNLSVKNFFLIAACWALACVLNVVYAKLVIAQTVQDAMSDYWSRGFAPATNFAGYIVWMYESISRELSFFLTAWMQYSIPSITILSKIILLLCVPGIIFLVKKYSYGILILFSPVIIALLLASFKILPFESRVAVYATWPFIISGIAGMCALQQWMPLFFKPFVTAALALIVALPVFFFTVTMPSERPPMQGQPAQPVLHELKKQLQQGDILFVYFKARHALHFYGPKEGISTYRTGGNYNTIEQHLRQLDSLKGNKRVWFFFSQWTEKQPFPDSIKAYLGTVIGKEIGKIPDPYGGGEDLEAAAHLYDLSK
jgi:hypothetical protein